MKSEQLGIVMELAEHGSLDQSIGKIHRHKHRHTHTHTHRQTDRQRQTHPFFCTVIFTVFAHDSAVVPNKEYNNDNNDNNNDNI